jgi:hypothetical protein
LTIFENLGPVSSACLGVTCKVLYGFRRQENGTVKLDTCDEGYATEYFKNGTGLANYLVRWVPLKIEHYDYKASVLVTKKKFRELTEGWMEDEQQKVVHLFPGLKIPSTMRSEIGIEVP